jgi:hypothetical protein
VLEIVRVVYNYVRPHSSLRTLNGNQTPVMAAGLTVRPLTLLEILGWGVLVLYWRKRELMEAAARCWESGSKDKMVINSERVVHPIATRIVRCCLTRQDLRSASRRYFLGRLPAAAYRFLPRGE